MDWGTVITIIGMNAGLIYWLRNDMKDFMNKIDSWKEEINREMKDFHGRLCSLEEKNKK
jgi:hypothetical protein